MNILFLSDFLPDEKLLLSKEFIDLLNNSDYVVFNLEGSPLMENDLDKDEQIMPFNVDFLFDFLSNFDTQFIIALANNHILDNGEKGFYYLLERLEQEQIKYFGTKNNPYINIESYYILNFVTGETVAEKKLGQKHLNYLFYDALNINNQIKKLEGISDNLILYPHWGRDTDASSFTTYNSILHFEKDWITFGHHSHIISDVKSNYIYSMGNNYIPHPNYYNRYPATRYGLTINLDANTKKYTINMTSLSKEEDHYLLKLKKYTGLNDDIKNHNVSLSAHKRLLYKLLAFRGNRFDKVKLYFLQVLPKLIKLVKN